MSLSAHVDPILASPGFFSAKLCRDGADVPCRLYKIEQRDEETGELTADVQYFAEIWLEPTDPFSPRAWPWTPITEAQFKFMVDDLKWCLENKPLAPIAQPLLPKRMAPAEYL
jgi:hypothetical protein